MKSNRPRLAWLVLPALMTLTLAGCPNPPSLKVTPQAISFDTTKTADRITIINAGSGALRWTAEEVFRADVNSPWEAQDVPWLSIDGPASGETRLLVSQLQIRVSRAGLASGLYSNAGIRILSNGGATVVPISMQVAATMAVSPTDFSLAPTATQAAFTVRNTGATAVDWEVLYLGTSLNPADATSLPADIQVTPNPGATAPQVATAVSVQWGAGRSDFNLVVRSVAGSAVLRIRFGAALEGLIVQPAVLTLYMDPASLAGGGGEQAASKLTIANAGTVTKSWTISLVSRINPGISPAISISPGSGSTGAGQLSEVLVRVTDPTGVEVGSGKYDLMVQSGGSFLVVPVVVELMSLPKIAVSEPPQPDIARPTIVPVDVLDFGREEIQKTFWIANIGPRDSRLYFRISHAGQGSEDALIADISPSQGGANGEDGNAQDFFHPELANVLIDGVAVTVTIDRSKLTQDVEFHEITVEAVDRNFEDVLGAVEKKTIKIRVERMPLTVEGTINRSRPPFVMRFVFLLRDTLGRAIPTRTQEDLNRIRFTVTEEGIPLDLDETSLYVTGPENLRVNLMLMLDYTGSMYYAGTRDAVNPLAPGEAVAQVKAAALHFLDDLPPGYRVGLMYYNDRQQPNRLIHALTTDREALKDALNRFTLPDAQFGVSTIYDALNDAIARIVADDAEDMLPFDDADIRAIVFITDGQDNASVATADTVRDAAKDTRVRLYPVGYSAGGPVNNKDLLVLASETGGHLFTAGNVRNLTRLLGNEKGLALEAADGGPNTVRFRVANVGETTLLWTAVVEDGAPWITSVSPASGGAAPGGATLVTVQVNSAMVSPDSAVLGIIRIASDNGEGAASIRMDVGADNALPEALTLELWDEPGRIWAELQHQLVLTYVTPRQTGGRYSIRVEYAQPDGADITGFFEEDGVFYPGDVLAGQIAMRTSGIQHVIGETDPDEAVRAEVYVRTDYVPRDVTRFRMRFFLSAPDDAPAAALSALSAVQMIVELAPDGLLITDDPFQPTWRLLEEGDGIYNLLTAQDNPLPYGSFGNLLKISMTGLADYVAAFAGTGRDPEFFVEMRVDNTIYVSPATPSQPSRTKYFLYPGGPTNPGRVLSVSLTPDAAPPARSANDMAFPDIDPEAPFAWDRDEDALPDFYDPYPDRADLPGRLVTPNPFEIGAVQSVGVLTIRNNRLDTFRWGIETASLPAWISAVRYGDGTALVPQSVLMPGERERIYLHVDRTGLPAGFVRGTVRVNTDSFGDDEIQVTVLVSAP